MTEMDRIIRDVKAGEYDVEFLSEKLPSDNQFTEAEKMENEEIIQNIKNMVDRIEQRYADYIQHIKTSLRK